MPARLACVKPAASVRSEPGSNSQVETINPPRLPDEHLPRRTTTVLDVRTFAHRSIRLRTETKRSSFVDVLVLLADNKDRQTVKLTLSSSDPEEP